MNGLSYFTSALILIAAVVVTAPIVALLMWADRQVNR